MHLPGVPKPGAAEPGAGDGGGRLAWWRRRRAAEGWHWGWIPVWGVARAAETMAWDSVFCGIGFQVSRYQDSAASGGFRFRAPRIPWIPVKGFHADTVWDAGPAASGRSYAPHHCSGRCWLPHPRGRDGEQGWVRAKACVDRTFRPALGSACQGPIAIGCAQTYSIAASPGARGHGCGRSAADPLAPRGRPTLSCGVTTALGYFMVSSTAVWHWRGPLLALCGRSRQWPPQRGSASGLGAAQNDRLHGIQAKEVGRGRGGALYEACLGLPAEPMAPRGHPSHVP